MASCIIVVTNSGLWPLIHLFNYFTPRSGQSQKATKFLNFILKIVKKEIARCEGPAKEVLFAWSHQRFFFNRLKSQNMVTTTTRDSFILVVKVLMYIIHQTIKLKGLHKISKNIAFVPLSET